ncbi:MAG: ComF family protein [Chloroflexota bacterium]|nr:ComF family protein [Chloroflexota bacterium]
MATWTIRLSGAADSALDLLFPPRCAGCDAPGQPFCDRCAQLVAPLPAQICAVCGRPHATAVALCSQCRHGRSHLRLSRAAALHAHPLREAIHALKYETRPELAGPLARYLVAVFQAPPWDALPAPIDAVVPVPLHIQRREERGYNQSELLAAGLCRATGLALEPAWLERIQATRQQVGLSAAERRQNVAGAFTAHSAVTGRCLLLVDDVYTTGATLEACAQAATAAGARAVYALTLAIPAHGAHP